MLSGETIAVQSDLQDTSQKIQALLQNINSVLIGQADAAKLAVTTLLAGGHLIIEDVPGVGKTLLAKSLAMSIKSGFKRVQCTPDLLPSDVAGVNIFEQREAAFKFVPGPIFTNILLCDEINRATPRTQSGLLEAMEERQVTIDGVTRQLPDLFFVIATQNPIEQHGTFPLPESQLDRFMTSLTLGYPDAEEEAVILHKTLEEEAFSVRPLLSAEDVINARLAAKKIFVHETLIKYIVDIVNATRSHSSIVLGVSPRGGQLLIRAGQAKALMEGRDFVTPEDIKELAPYIFGHRILPKIRANRISHAEVIEKVLETVRVPG